jgi:hypothetical protein
MHEEGLTPAEQELESVLGQLKPAPNMLNRDELMFNAGIAAAGRKRPWQMLSGVLTILLLGSVLVQVGLNGGGELSSPPITAQHETAQTLNRSVQFESGGSLGYVTLRRNVVERGLDALPLRRGVSGGAQRKNRKQLLKSMLSS